MQENGMTKYAALMEELKGRILSGEVKPGELLPDLIRGNLPEDGKLQRLIQPQLIIRESCRKR